VNRRPRWPVAIFAACALGVAAALAFVTLHALRLERREADARAQAGFQESIRLALWRMDSQLAPLIAREASRPYFHYQPFYPADRAYTRMFANIDPGEVLVPSPLLQPSEPLIRLHFQRSEGALASPQAPSGEWRLLAESAFVPGYDMLSAEGRLAELGALLASDKPTSGRSAFADGAAADENVVPADPANAPRDADAYGGEKQAAQSLSEYRIREEVSSQARAPGRRNAAEAAPHLEFSRADRPAAPDEVDASGLATLPALRLDPEPAVAQSEFAPSWLESPGDPELVFTRRIDAPGRSFEQGFWLDWPALRASLLASATDLLPDASLRPVRSEPAATTPAVMGRMLAAIPAELVAGAAPVAVLLGWSPVRTTLALTWIATLLGVGAVAAALRAANELAERRGRFVSAVTHELRTPLTTFCLYSQMLADGMIPDEAARQGYFATLRTESQRLARIVESVLDYARLGRPHAASIPITLGVAELLRSILPPLVARCDAAGARFAMHPEVPPGTAVTTTPATVERILANLVDNACKYGAPAAGSPTVDLDVQVDGGRLALIVRDAGPGVEPAERSRVFRPFVRGRSQGDGSTSGLGLGLALASDLARELGGDLRLIPSPRGAAFRLTIPLDRA